MLPVTNRQVHVEERVAVAASPLVVWEALTDWEGQSGWMVATTVTTEPGGGHRVGERLTAVTKVAGVGFSDAMEVTRWDPPRRVEVAHLGRLGFALLRPAFQLMLRRSLRRLARQVERGPRPFDG